MALQEIKDLYIGNNFFDKAAKEGFEVVLQIPYARVNDLIKLEVWSPELDKNDYALPVSAEVFLLLFNIKKGILLKINTTSNGTRINNMAIYFNWAPSSFGSKSVIEWHDMSGSGRFYETEQGQVKSGWMSIDTLSENVWVVIDNMSTKGSFVTPWIKQPFFALYTEYEIDLFKDHLSRFINFRLPFLSQKGLPVEGSYGRSKPTLEMGVIDTSDYIKILNEQRINLLPKEVQKIICSENGIKE